MDRRKFIALISTLLLPTAGLAQHAHATAPDRHPLDVVNAQRRIKIVAVGTGACNLVASSQDLPQGMERICVDTDPILARNSQNAVMVHFDIGRRGDSYADHFDRVWSRFQGSSGTRATAALQRKLKHADGVVVVSCLGRATGSILTPMVVEAVAELGAQAIVIAALPFPFEGQKRMAVATHVAGELAVRQGGHRPTVAALEVVRHGDLIRQFPDGTTLLELFQAADREIVRVATNLGRSA